MLYAAITSAFGKVDPLLYFAGLIELCMFLLRATAEQSSIRSLFMVSVLLVLGFTALESGSMLMMDYYRRG